MHVSAQLEHVEYISEKHVHDSLPTVSGWNTRPLAPLPQPASIGNLWCERWTSRSKFDGLSKARSYIEVLQQERRMYAHPGPTC